LDGDGFEDVKNEVIGFWRKGTMPLMFQEKMRIVLGLVGGGTGRVGWSFVLVGVLIFCRLDGGGLISRLMLKEGLIGVWF
jgi:hypothetical protein